MPPPGCTQLSSSRRRGRPPKTPTKGPDPKKVKTLEEDAAVVSGTVDSSANSSSAAPPPNEHPALLELCDKDKWLADRAPLFSEKEVQELCENPQNVLLEPAQVDTILQHIVLSHGRPLLLVAALHSTEFATNLLQLNANAATTRLQRFHLATAAVPALHDDRVFGDVASFQTIILPIYLPGHYVLGIYDVRGDRLHYYDSLPTPSIDKRDYAEGYLKTTVKQVLDRFRPGKATIRFEPRADSTYPKQSDGSSCGFFVCYYVEAFLTLRRSSEFFMADANFMRDYRTRVLSVLLAVCTWDVPDYVPLSGFVDGYRRTQTQPTPRRSSARLTQAESRTNASSVQNLEVSPTPATALVSSAVQSTKVARASKEVVECLIRTMTFKPDDTASAPAQLSPRAMFMYLRVVASLYRLPIAIASPLMAAQKVFGKNVVRDVGLKFHKPSTDAHYVLLPYPIAGSPDADFADQTSASVHWILAIHALEKNATAVYDPAKCISGEVLAATEQNLKNMVATLRRALLRTSTATWFSIADARSYSAFSTPQESALGVLALGESYVAGSVARLRFNDFSM
ncbi:hypothetical protein AAVH_43010, partial [Aphelenchoides avenae]